MGPRILKELATTIAPIPTDIYKQSYETREVPVDWQKVNMTPIIKKNERMMPVTTGPPL